MWNRLRRWLDDLASPDPIARQTARLLEIMLIGLVIAASLALLLMLTLAPRSLFGVLSILSAFLSMAISIGALLLLRRGRVKSAAWIAAIGLLTANALILLPAGLAMSGALLLAFAAPIALSSLLLGRPGLLIASGASISIVGLTAMLEHLSPPLAGFATQARPDSWATAAIFVLMIGVLGLFLDHFGSSLRAALAKLQTANEQLRDELTERQRAEAALRESEKTYRSLMEQAADGIAITGPDGRYRVANSRMCELLGYKLDELLQLTVHDIMAPADLESASLRLDELRTGMTVLSEHQLRRKDGTLLPVEISARMLDDGRFQAMVRDISEQVRVAETLRQQNAYLTGLHETTLALMNRLDLEDLLQTIVAHAARLVCDSRGFLYLAEPQEQVLELKVSSGLFNPTPTPRLRPGEGVAGIVWQTGQMLVVNNYDQWPDRVRTIPYGAYHGLMGAPLKVGEQVVGVIGLIRATSSRSFDENEAALLKGYAQLASIAFDNARLYADAQRELTARTQAIAALRDSEELYRLITENTRDLITLLDQEGCCVYASPSCSSILGYAQIELIGTTITNLVHPDDQAAVAEQMRRLSSSSTAQAAFRARHASGAWRWLETFWTATTQDGVRYNLAVGRDITERKRLEAQFLQAQKMESIGRLAGGVAHDFNNLLTAIMSYTELARDGLAPGDPVCEDLDEVAGAARRAADLTSQLLAFARKQIIEPQALNLNALLKDMDRLLRRVIGEAVELDVRLAPDLDYVKADPGQIEQVLINMAVNARDAMPEGGKLVVETRNVELDPTFAEQHIGLDPGHYVLLEISDTGVGMDAETQRQIFEPFFTTKERGRGTGLGLATCYGIIKQHGGSIVLYSEVGFGSTFKIYLPRVPAPLVAAPHQAAPAAAPNGSETILLAEDEQAVRMLASRVLRERGYTVLEAADGVEALRVAQERGGTAIDLLLTDMVMPKMGGGTLAARVQELYPGIRVLFISGYTDSALIQHGQLDDGMEFMHKPFSPADLARKVRELLDS